MGIDRRGAVVQLFRGDARHRTVLSPDPDRGAFVPLSQTPRVIRVALSLAIAGLVVLGLIAPATVAADSEFTMTARALLQGHVRQGAWFAIAVDVQNNGPTVSGEL